jgi:hypothetical protein
MSMLNSVTQIITYSFFLSLAFGTQLFLPVVNSKLTGVGFYKLGASIVLGCLVFAVGVASFMQPALDHTSLGCFAFLILSHILCFALHRDQKSLLMWILYVLQFLIFTFLVFHLFLMTPHWIMFFFFSALLLGISNFSMILGHYYLVVPKLTEEPLIYCLFIFWTVFFLKLMFSLSVLFTSAVPFLQEGSQLGDGYTFNWLFISMRYLWGYLAPLILSFFTFRLCKLRSIQSATGVLYIVEFFVIVGELISVYLMSKHGLAL